MIALGGAGLRTTYPPNPTTAATSPRETIRFVRIAIIVTKDIGDANRPEADCLTTERRRPLPRAEESCHNGWGMTPRTGPDTVVNVSLVERYKASDKRHPFRNDASFGALLFVLATANACTNQVGPHGLAVSIGFIALACTCIGQRRRFPCISLGGATAVIVALFFVSQDDGTAQITAFWSAMYTVGTLGAVSPRKPKWLRTDAGVRSASRSLSLSVVVVSAAIGIFTGAFTDSAEKTDVANTTLTLILVGVFVGSAWFIGDLVRLRRLAERSLADQNSELVEQRETNARRAVLDERVRISRELHDVVAHHVSLMGLQAGAARLAVRQRPEQAEAALAEVERSSRQAVSELHRLLGFLRQDELDSTAPQPTIGDLDALVADVRRAGREVTLVRSLPTERVAPSMQLTVYRIVQEALTNALKHSSFAPINIEVSTTDDALRVVIHDHGKPWGPPAKPLAKNSHGLVGIRERVAFHGGTLIVGPTPSGFSVDAALPLVARS